MGEKYDTSNIASKGVYDFLEEECSHFPLIWEEFGEGILSHTENTDFWEHLSEQLDCFRICDECGKPMIEGYLVDGCDTYCSEECLHTHISDEDFNKRYNNGDGDTYWTTWYEDSVTFKNGKK